MARFFRTPKHPPWYYQWAIVVARPIYRAMLFFKQQQLPYYHREIEERFGCAYQAPKPLQRGYIRKKVIWCHAVCLGEINTAYPLLKSLLDDGHGLYITSTTQTGFAQVERLFASYLKTHQVVHGFVPVDDRAVVYRFIRRINPHLALFIETELWANTLYLLAKHQIPAVMVNARLNQRSFEKYKKVKKLSQSMMANLSLVIAQDERSAERFLALGLDKDKCVLADSLKWSASQAANKLPSITHLTQSLNANKRPVWVAGSTHEGEEFAVLNAHKDILQTHPTALLIIVPRHPERFDAVWQLCLESGLICHRRHENAPITDETQVYLADSMGELLAWYDCSDVALVAGSLVDIGGHNPIEPASFAKPIIMGQYVRACEVLVQALAQVGALVQVGDAQDVKGIAHAVIQWFDSPSKAQLAGQAGQLLAKSKQTASDQQKQYLLPYLR